MDSEGLFVAYVPLANRIAWEFAGRLPYELDDLRSVAYEGLIDAIARYDGERGSLGAYATVRIRGTIRDWLRTQDPLGRHGRDRVKELDRVREEFVARTGTTPTPSDFAAATGWDQRKVDQTLALRARSGRVRPLEVEWRDADPTPGPSEIAVERLLVERVCAIMRDHLTPQAIEVMVGVVNEERGVDIARRLGISESRVSQIRKTAAETVRRHVGSLHG